MRTRDSRISVHLAIFLFTQEACAGSLSAMESLYCQGIHHFNTELTYARDFEDARGSEQKGRIANSEELATWRTWRKRSIAKSLSCRAAKPFKMRSTSIWRQISMDSVSIGLHQREFADEISSVQYSYLNSPLHLHEAITRYYKFMLLLSSSGGTGESNLVPTTEIDLVWHTHQLFGWSYHKWCTANVGRPIDHDNLPCEADRIQAFNKTNEAWSKVYDEAYTTSVVYVRMCQPTGGSFSR
jgi:Glycine-rich domain-containing protein-like